MYTTTTNEREREFTGTRYTREPQRTKKILKQKKKKENTARGSAFLRLFLFFLFEKCSKHTHNQNNKEIYMKERRGKGGIN